MVKCAALLCGNEATTLLRIGGSGVVNVCARHAAMAATLRLSPAPPSPAPSLTPGPK